MTVTISHSNPSDEEGLPETPVIFDCQGESLVGILHHGIPAASRAVVLVVGGPQYRVGSHRQFVLLARYLAAQGIPVLRFDYRGMGDSSGALQSFEAAKPDIRASIDCLFTHLPQVREVVLWGLCDAATVASFYAPTDNRVTGLVLANPWVRSEAGIARAYLQHYYWQRLVSRDFWYKLVSGRFQVRASLRSLLGFISRHRAEQLSTGASFSGAEPSLDADLQTRMLQGLRAFAGRTLLILSGHDLTAKEFLDNALARQDWQR